MTKGLWTQGVAILLDGAVSLDEIAPLLGDFEIVNRVDAGESWEMGGETLVLGFRPEVNGYVSLDIASQPWPDAMGDPQDQVMLFGAWSMGYFGPLTFPGNLERAAGHAVHWPEAADAVGAHTAWVRLRCSYAFGARDDAPVMPADYDAGAEIEFLGRLALAVLQHPRALCFFHPAGEMLLSQGEFRERIAHDAAHGLPPLDAWSQVRFFNVREGWAMMDSVGMEAFDAPDHEACFPESYDPGEVAAFLRNIALYRWQNGDVLRDGHTSDGPGQTRWRVQNCAESLTAPPRPTLRWVPENIPDLPPELGFTLAPTRKSPWWNRR